MIGKLFDKFIEEVFAGDLEVEGVATVLDTGVKEL